MHATSSCQCAVLECDVMYSTEVRTPHSATTHYALGHYLTYMDNMADGSVSFSSLIELLRNMRFDQPSR